MKNCKKHRGQSAVQCLVSGPVRWCGVLLRTESGLTPAPTRPRQSAITNRFWGSIVARDGRCSTGSVPSHWGHSILLIWWTFSACGNKKGETVWDMSQKSSVCSENLPWDLPPRPRLAAGRAGTGRHRCQRPRPTQSGCGGRGSNTSSLAAKIFGSVLKILVILMSWQLRDTCDGESWTDFMWQCAGNYCWIYFRFILGLAMYLFMMNWKSICSPMRLDTWSI